MLVKSPLIQVTYTGQNQTQLIHSHKWRIQSRLRENFYVQFTKLPVQEQNVQCEHTYQTGYPEEGKKMRLSQPGHENHVTLRNQESMNGGDNTAEDHCPHVMLAEISSREQVNGSPIPNI
jgi:hypothetical protein